MVFTGVEPNLRWRSYSQGVARLAASEQGVETVIHVGALLDAVPHTRPVKLSGTATRPDLSEFLEGREIRSSNYQGPTGISSSVMDACIKQGLGYSSIWGHTPHYLQAAPNYRVAYSLMQTLTRLLKPASWTLRSSEGAASKFDEEVARAVQADDQIGSYVAKLEGQYDEKLGRQFDPRPRGPGPRRGAFPARRALTQTSDPCPQAHPIFGYSRLNPGWPSMYSATSGGNRRSFSRIPE